MKNVEDFINLSNEIINNTVYKFSESEKSILRGIRGSKLLEIIQ